MTNNCEQKNLAKKTVIDGRKENIISYILGLGVNSWPAALKVSLTK